MEAQIAATRHDHGIFREGTVASMAKENRSRLVTAGSALVIANERLADIGATERGGCR